MNPVAKATGRGRHQGDGEAEWSTESDWTGRGVAHKAGPRGKPERQAAGHNHGTGTGAKQQRPPGAAKLGRAQNMQRTRAREKVPDNTQPKHHKPQPGMAGRS